MNNQSLHILMLAAKRYIRNRTLENRIAMLAVGSVLWDGFPDFLADMKEAIQAGGGKEFLKPGDIKHMYALLFVGILNGLDAESLDKVSGALLDAADQTQSAMAG
jgi:hypothetical protein